MTQTPKSVLIRRRYRGQATKHMARTCGSKWGDAQFGPSSHKPWRCYKRSNTSLGKIPFPLDSLALLMRSRSFMSDKIMPLSKAVEGYDLFDKMKVQKVVFEAQK